MARLFLMIFRSKISREEIAGGMHALGLKGDSGGSHLPGLYVFLRIRETPYAFSGGGRGGAGEVDPELGL